MRLLAPSQEPLERFVLFLTRNRDEARDIVSETLLIAYEKLDTLREEIAFPSYLMTIARRTFYNRRTRTRTHEHYEAEQLDELFGDGMAPDEAMDVTILYQALDQLPAAQKEAIIMAEIMGFSHKEIQKVQGGTVTGVKVRIFRGKRQLAKLLGAESAQNNEVVELQESIV
ncbi:MAG: RNA polymerase sigma factor [Candidatus Kapaibacterium sp.]